ncbi:hypothetical protein L9F63_010498, partial [Diploptera punctata]
DVELSVCSTFHSHSERDSNHISSRNRSEGTLKTDLLSWLTIVLIVNIIHMYDFSINKTSSSSLEVLGRVVLPFSYCFVLLNSHYEFRNIVSVPSSVILAGNFKVHQFLLFALLNVDLFPNIFNHLVLNLLLDLFLL